MTWTDLHAYCFEAKWDEVRRHVVSHPHETAVKHHLDLLPLHWATFKNAPEDVVERLLVFREGAQYKSEEGNLPLHYAAAKRNPQGDVVGKLLEAYPAGAMETNVDGSLPLHLAARGKAPADVIVKLLVAYPSGAQVEDN